MTADSPPPTTVFAGGSVIRTGAGWWLASGAGAVRADAQLCAELDEAAAAMALADRAVAALRPGIGGGR
jgi:hypothetical protein